jgi:hypothetical protein
MMRADEKVHAFIARAMADLTYFATHQRVATHKSILDWADAVKRLLEVLT